MVSIEQNGNVGTIPQEKWQQLLYWYRNLVRKLLIRQQQSEKVAALDADNEYLLHQAIAEKKPVSVCFLGSSGVGKSTLINAVVAGADVVVPHGGVGPLTAKELRISYGDKPSITAIYHEPRHVWRLVFALVQMFEGQLTAVRPGDRVLDELLDGLGEDDKSEQEQSDPNESHFGMSKAETYRKLGTLVITGSQDTGVPVEYVIDSLRETIGKSRCYGTTKRPEDEPRIGRLRQLFETKDLKSPYCFECTSDNGEFASAVRDHASGYLAPLVSEFICEWNCDLLRKRIEIVDLPGLGVAGDVYRKVTDQWVRKSAQIVVLVVDHRGIRDSDAELLRTSGFLTRLLHAADDPKADPVSLVVAVVKVDDIADSRRREDKSKTKLEHFADIRAETQKLLREQLRQRLKEAWTDQLNPTRNEAKEGIIERLVNESPICPLSAIQYCRLLSEDEDDRPFIKTEDDSGVPQFIAGLEHITSELQRERRRKLVDRFQLFDAEVCSVLRLIQARLKDSSATSEQALRIKRELELFLQPLREELRTRQGQFRSYLKDVLPSRIETLVHESRETASKDIRKYVKKLRDVHWATIRAAIRRGGTYHGSRQIEIPRDFAQSFEEPIAEIWGKRILMEVRQRTKQYAGDCSELVTQVAVWGKNHSQVIEPEIVEAQLAAIKVDAKKLETVGREMVNELREAVRNRLLAAIESPIRRKCQNFVRRNADVGIGVKMRMHELLDDLVDESMDAAVPVAQEILIENYLEMERDIRKAFENYQDPLKTLFETITTKFDAQEDEKEVRVRRTALTEIAEALSQKPSDPELLPNSQLESA